jgi:predicted metalloprotease
MKWTDDRSGNVEDRRGSGSGGAIVGGGLGTLIIAAIVFFLGETLLLFFLQEIWEMEERKLNSAILMPMSLK